MTLVYDDLIGMKYADYRKFIDDLDLSELSGDDFDIIEKAGGYHVDLKRANAIDTRMARYSIASIRSDEDLAVEHFQSACERLGEINTSELQQSAAMSIAEAENRLRSSGSEFDKRVLSRTL